MATLDGLVVAAYFLALLGLTSRDRARRRARAEGRGARDDTFFGGVSLSMNRTRPARPGETPKP